MADIKKYLDQAGLEALVTQIKAEDTKALNAAKAYADGLADNYDASGSAATAEKNAKDYADSLAGNYDAAGSAAAVDGKLTAEVERATKKEAELLAAIEATDAIADKNAEDIAAINNETTGILAQAKADAKSKADAVQAEVDALEEYVGTFTASEGVDTVVKYIDAKTANIASDETVGALDDRLTQAEKDIDAIEADYLKAADKTELSNAIDAEKQRAEGIEGGLDARIKAVEDDYLKAEDKTELTNAIATAKQEAIATVLGEGTDADFDTLKEVADWILSDTTGAAALQTDVATLKTEMDAVEGKVEVLEGEMDAVEAAVATKAEAQALADAVAALEGADAGQVSRIAALESKFGGAEGSVEDMIADAKQEAITSATGAAAADATSKADAAREAAKTYADGLNTSMSARVDALEAIDHEHANKELLDSYTQTEANLADAVAKKHAHENKTVLDGITSEKVAAWDAAEGNAKTYADGLNSTMTSKVDAIDGRVTTVEGAVGTKAEASALTALAERVTTAEAGIAANASAIAAFSPIDPTDIAKLFA